MRRLLIALAGIALLLPPVPVRAEEMPFASRRDPRMRYVIYDQGQVVHLSTAPGATLVVGFGSHETITAVAVTDSKDLAASPRGNYLFFKSKIPLPLQPVIVLTTSGAGLRRYVFDIETIAAPDLGPDAPDVYYSVQFLYPNEAAAARRAAATATAAAAAKEPAAAQGHGQAPAAPRPLQLAPAALARRARDPFQGPRNWHYVARGDRSLLPLEVFDNGYSTVFRFPGDVRLPGVFMINPDGKEATPNYAVKGDLVQVDSVARGWRLRDGQTVLCIWNLRFDPVGDNPGTGTTSPGVQRVIDEAPP